MSTNETEASYIRLQNTKRRRALLRRIAVFICVVLLASFAYLGFARELWGTGLILVPAGIGCIIGWAIDEGITWIAGN